MEKSSWIAKLTGWRSSTANSRPRDESSEDPLLDEPYREIADLFTANEIAAMIAAIESSPHLSGNQLGPRFARSRGFSVVFRRDSRKRAKAEYPAFTPYLDRVLHPGANGFYLNPLVLESGASVGPHVDTSLSSHVGTRVHPLLVSVLYLSVPQDMRGGLLLLRDRRHKVGQVAPEAGVLLEFRGNLTHSVGRQRASEPRVSLICEQYRLPPEQLERVPELAVISAESAVRGRY